MPMPRLQRYGFYQPNVGDFVPGCTCPPSGCDPEGCSRCATACDRDGDALEVCRSLGGV